MNLDKIHTIYFVGIGGIGMSALARYFAVNGKKVAGFDKVQTDITNSLSQLGVDIHYQDSIDLIPSNFKDSQKIVKSDV